MLKLMLLQETTALNPKVHAVLSKLGDVIHARSVIEAVAQCQALAPEAIVTDCVIQNTNVADFLPELSAVAPDTPIIVLAQTDTAKATVPKMRQGAFSVLAKPVDEDELVKVVELALASAAARPAPEPAAPSGAKHEDEIILSTDLTLREAEDMFIQAVLRRHDGSIATAAKSLGVSASTLYRRQDRKAD